MIGSTTEAIKTVGIVKLQFINITIVTPGGRTNAISFHLQLAGNAGLIINRN